MNGKTRTALTLALIVVLFLLSASMLPGERTRQDSGPVHNIDKGTYYSTIQSAIDDAATGDTIEVSPGTYAENLVIDKTINLVGEDRNTTFIDGGNIGDVVLITSDLVNISGFTIMNSGPDWFGSKDSGIKVEGAHNCSIANNTIIDNEIGVSISSVFGTGDSLQKLWHWGGSSLDINNKGNVVWIGISDTPNEIVNWSDENERHVFLWDGNSTVQLTQGYFVDLANSNINDNGEIVWMGSEYIRTTYLYETWVIEGKEWEIYFWDGNEIIQITDNDLDDEDPDINDLGQIVWERNNDIMFWDGTDIIELTNNSIDDYHQDRRPKINNNGQIVWEVVMEWPYTQIMFWDGDKIIQLTNYTYGASRPIINSNGHVVFRISDETGSEIGYWNGQDVIQLTDDNNHVSDYGFNDRNQIVWESQDNIMFWDGNDTIQLSTTPGDHPSINNNGHVIWQGRFTNEIYYWDGINTSIITGGELFGNLANLNDAGQVVWDEHSLLGPGVMKWNGGEIDASYANDNIIIDNIISENEHGIRIETAYDNRIFHNCFINNSNQSFCQQSNVWDNGYPSGGNYWSDYNGTDTRSGPNQDVEGSDGIGDVAYSIPGGSYVDGYPLMITNPGNIILPTPIPPDKEGFPWLPVTLISIIGIGAGLGVGIEVFKYSLMLLFLPLYMKLKKEDVLDHYIRGKIHGYIVANPGEHYNAIKKALQINNGSLAYHLSVLEKEELVKSRNEGVYKRFYPYTMNVSDNGDALTQAQKLILIQIKNNPGLNQKQISVKLGIHPSTVNYHIKNLSERDLIRAERKGLGYRYYKR